MNGKYLFVISGMAIGLFLIIGTIFRIKILVDPDKRWARSYTNSFLNKYFGSDFLVIYNYILGSLVFLCSIFLLFQLIMKKI
jgi:hypothetical protein